ncbi:hypothetical protein ABZT51_28120 [Streptomyces sp. NPDC005373]|uniref:hypothetical protein n=1 Tax=Streptomyces sp. NPDC005373 TaxID=3156879 RepID=UPI0033B32550
MSTSGSSTVSILTPEVSWVAWSPVSGAGTRSRFKGASPSSGAGLIERHHLHGEARPVGSLGQHFPLPLVTLVRGAG